MLATPGSSSSARVTKWSIMGRSTTGTLALYALGIVCIVRIIYDLLTLGRTFLPPANIVTTVTTTSKISTTPIPTEHTNNENPHNKNKNKTAELFLLFQEYANWHAKQLEEIRKNPDSWTNKKYSYLVMECRTQWNPTINQTQFGPCGGLADRLKPFPFVLWAAAKSHRIFFISWNRPFELEAFLEPPAIRSNSLMGRIDWRVPDELSRRGFHDDVTPTRGMTIDHEKSVYPRAMQTAIQILRTKIQSPGEQAFTKKAGGVVYADIYSRLWHLLFQPVSRLQQKMDAQLDAHQLVPDQYVATHLRLQYPTANGVHHGHAPNHNKVKQQKTRTQIAKATTHALQCASVAYPGAPIFVATDSPGTVRPVVHDLVQKYKNDSQTRIRIVMLPPSSSNTTLATTNNTDKSLHLDHDSEWQNRTPDEYDSVFIDLYLLGQARCVMYGRGGYGKLGSLLSSGAATCGFDVSATQLPCPWTLWNGTTIL